jgi:hypothetical protein
VAELGGFDGELVLGGGAFNGELVLWSGESIVGTMDSATGGTGEQLRPQ